MAVSALPTTTYPASHFLESAGCVIFHLSSAHICLQKYLREQDRWILPKGRRNLNESRPCAALREVKEETGYACRLLPVTMQTRCPPADDDDPNVPDLPREESRITEPFMLMVRDTTAATASKSDLFGEEESVKLIWWYVAVYEGNIDQTSQGLSPKGEDWYSVEWFSYRDAVERLSFETDREVVRRAIEIVEATYHSDSEEIHVK